MNPHDMHNWGSSETPILVDDEFKGKQRKMVLHADRKGYFWALDRTTRAHLLTSTFSRTVNRVKEINAKGQTIRDVAKDSSAPARWLRRTSAEQVSITTPCST